MKTYSPAFSAFAGQPIYIDESKSGGTSIVTVYRDWSNDLPVLRQARFLADKNGVATDIPNPDYTGE
jgi:hypothetical protein